MPYHNPTKATEHSLEDLDRWEHDIDTCGKYCTCWLCYDIQEDIYGWDVEYYHDWKEAQRLRIITVWFDNLTWEVL